MTLSLPAESGQFKRKPDWVNVDGLEAEYDDHAGSSPLTAGR